MENFTKKGHHMNESQNNDIFEIDLLHLIKLLLKRLWIIVLCAVLAGGIALSYAVFLVTPTYESTAKLYVNNSSFSFGGASVSISSGELSAAKSLLETYIVILKTRTTLEKVIEDAELDYTYEELRSRVSASSVNNTEIFQITVEGPDPEENKLIIDTIVAVLPDIIASIIDGSSVRLVEQGVKATERSSPSYTKYTLIGAVIGTIISCGIIIVADLFDSSVRNEDYLKQKYNIPIFAVIPDASDVRGNYYKKSYYSYGKRGGEQ